MRWIEGVGEKHGVVDRAAQRNALLLKEMHGQLQVVGLFLDCGIFDEDAEFVGQGELESHPWLSGNAEGEVLLLFFRGGEIEDGLRGLFFIF